MKRHCSTAFGVGTDVKLKKLSLSHKIQHSVSIAVEAMHLLSLKVHSTFVRSKAPVDFFGDPDVTHYLVETNLILGNKRHKTTTTTLILIIVLMSSSTADNFPLTTK